MISNKSMDSLNNDSFISPFGSLSIKITCCRAVSPFVVLPMSPLAVPPPPLSCRATVSLVASPPLSLHHHLSCTSWLLNCHSFPAVPPLFITLCVAPSTSSLTPHPVRRHRPATTVVAAMTAVRADGSSSSSRPHPRR